LGLGLSSIESKTAEKMVFAPAAVEQASHVHNAALLHSLHDACLEQATDVASVSAGGLHTL
jgi:hypothetical protein